MKCPKCGYNSFEHHDSCIKCSHDLAGYKQTYGLKPLVIPQAARTMMAESLAATSVGDSPLAEKTTAVPPPEDMFSFNLPDTAPAPAPAAIADPFNFNEKPPVAAPQSFGDVSLDEGAKSAQTRAEEDAFANLLESTSLDTADKLPEPTPESGDVFADIFAAAPEAPATEPAAPADAAADGSGEFELENFSWDDTPVSSAGDGPKSPENGFDNLFGEPDDSKK